MVAVPSTVELTTRVRGLLLGAAVGDALGWPQEQRSGIRGGDRARNVAPGMAFRKWLRWTGYEGARYEDLVARGEYSDDTQLLLATARACLGTDDWLQWLMKTELPVWPVYQRGGGRAVLRACRSWQDALAPWNGPQRRIDAYFGAGANGAAMRIAPHAVVTISDTSSHRLIERVLKDSVLTHGHPRALVGAVVHALAVRFMLQRGGSLEYGDLVAELLEQRGWADSDLAAGSMPTEWLKRFAEVVGIPFSHAWDECVGEMDDLLRITMRSLSRGALADDEKTLSALGCFDASRNGAGTVTAAAACYLVSRHAIQPSMGLLGSAFLSDADTDTLGSMTTSLLGALHGPDWLEPLLQDLQDREYIQMIADSLVASIDGVAPLARRTAAPLLDAWMSELVNGGPVQVFADGRSLTGVTRSALLSRGRGRVYRFRLSTVDGQTMVVDRPASGPSGTGPSERGSAADSNTVPLTHAGGTDVETPYVTTVAIRVRDLAATRHFYAEILGLRVVDAKPALLVAPSLAFLEGTRSDQFKEGTALVRIHASNIERIRNSLEKNKVIIRSVEHLEKTESLSVFDPDGNEVFIWARK